MSAPRICYLTYLSRSGSTLFARLLNERYRVCVTPEGSVPAEMVGVNGFEPPRFEGPEAAEAYLRAVSRVSKLDDWKLAEGEVVARLRAWPATGVDLFNALLETYRDVNAPGDPIVVYKGDPVMPWEARRALKANPGAQAIYVVRDPRAILHSQRTSRYAYAGGAFSHSAAHTAVEWRRLAEAVAAIDAIDAADAEADAAGSGSGTGSGSGGRELWLRYEDLVRDETGELARLARALGAERRGEGESSNFLDRVAEAERHLHAHVAARPSAERIDRWRGELDARDGDLLQEMVRDGMTALGYEIEQSARPARWRVAVSWLRYRILSARHNLARQLRNLAQDPKYVLRKVQARLAGAAKGRSA